MAKKMAVRVTVATLQGEVIESEVVTFDADKAGFTTSSGAEHQACEMIQSAGRFMTARSNAHRWGGKMGRPPMPDSYETWLDDNTIDDEEDQG